MADSKGFRSCWSSFKEGEILPGWYLCGVGFLKLLAVVLILLLVGGIWIFLSDFVGSTALGIPIYNNGTLLDLRTPPKEWGYRFVSGSPFSVAYFLLPLLYVLAAVSLKRSPHHQSAARWVLGMTLLVTVFTPLYLIARFYLPIGSLFAKLRRSSDCRYLEGGYTFECADEFSYVIQVLGILCLVGMTIIFGGMCFRKVYGDIVSAIDKLKGERDEEAQLLELVDDEEPDQPEA